MTREEIALQLTLARLGKLEATAFYSDDVEKRKLYNEELANETYKLFNTIYKNLEIEEDENWAVQS